MPLPGQHLLLVSCLIAFIVMQTGDDWEHEETFTDDDEAVGNDPEEREEQVPEGPAPPEIKQVKSRIFQYRTIINI